LDHSAVMNGCDAKAERLGLQALTEPERVVLLVSRANFEIELGGLSGFYYNNAGNLASETVAALEAVGAVQAASALRAANTLFPGGTPPKNREQRYEVWRGLIRLNTDLLGSLDKTFSAEDPDVFSRLCAYIEAHAAELKQHEESSC
jgi:hypothetical protein